MAIIENEFKISMNDVDQNAVCTQKSVLKFFETVACEHSDLAGFGISTMEQTKKSWVLLQWKVTFYAYPEYGKLIKVKTWARDTDAYTSYRDFLLTDSRGKIYARATSKWAFIDIYKGLSRIGSVISDNYNPEETCVYENRTLDKLKPLQDCLHAFDYEVRNHYIDVHRHMHNLNYLDLAQDAFEYGETQNYNTLEIYYKTQSKLGDNLSIFKGEIQNGKAVQIMSGEKLSAIIKFYN